MATETSENRKIIQNYYSFCHLEKPIIPLNLVTKRHFNMNRLIGEGLM